MAKFKEVKKGKRLWLNSLSSCDIGAMQWSVSGHSKDVSADVTFWDCDRKISLDFCTYTNYGRLTNVGGHKRRLKKIDLIISNLQEMREAMVEASELVKPKTKAENELEGLRRFNIEDI
jgi:hypothetical protein